MAYGFPIHYTCIQGWVTYRRIAGRANNMLPTRMSWSVSISLSTFWVKSCGVLMLLLNSQHGSTCVNEWSLLLYDRIAICISRWLWTRLDSDTWPCRGECGCRKKQFREFPSFKFSFMCSNAKNSTLIAFVFLSWMLFCWIVCTNLHYTSG